MTQPEHISEIARLEAEIHRQIQARQARNANTITQQQLTFSDRMSDTVAQFTGSWTFLIAFGVMLALWVVFNTIWVMRTAFDPYPFILLNLVLALVSAVQAPLIMMSQNRQASQDRVRSEIEYQVNLKSEIILEHLHDKVEQVFTDIEGQLTAINSRLDDIQSSMDSIKTTPNAPLEKSMPPQRETGEVHDG